MRLYLTGATGLLGSYVAEAAIAKGAEVVALARSLDDADHLKSLGVTLSLGDLGDTPSLIAGMRGCEAVIHIASPKGGWKKPAVYAAGSINGTRNIISAMTANSIKSLVYVSTISVHGLDPLQGETVSEASGFGKQFLPYDYYGRAKVKAEQIVQQAHTSAQIQAAVLRPGWIYGPRDESSYCRLADRMRQGLVYRIGDGKNRLPLVYAGNVAQVTWRLLVCPSPEYRVYLYAYDGHVTQNDYLASLARAAQAACQPVPVPKSLLLALAGLQEHLSVVSGYRLPAVLPRYFIHLFASDWKFNQGKMENELGFSPATHYQQGFQITEEWYRRERGCTPGRHVVS